MLCIFETDDAQHHCARRAPDSIALSLTACRRLRVAAGVDLHQLTVLPRLDDERKAPLATLFAADGVRFA
jgi:hypothetical protein